MPTGRASPSETNFDNIAFCAGWILGTELVNRWEKHAFSTDAGAGLANVHPLQGAASGTDRRFMRNLGLVSRGRVLPHLPAQSRSKDVPDTGRIKRVTGGRQALPNPCFHADVFLICSAWKL